MRVVKGVAHEGARRRCTHETDTARGLQPQLTECRPDEIGRRATPELAEGLRPGDRLLALSPEADDRVRQLLGLCQRDGGGAELGEQSDHFRILGGGGKAAHDCAQGQAPPVHDLL